LEVSGAGSLANTLSLTVAAGAHFDYQPTTIGTVLSVGTNATMNLADGSAIGLTWNTTTSSVIAVDGAATVGTGAGVGVDMSGSFSNGFTYTILQAGSGLGTGNYHLLNPTTCTATFTKAATQVQIKPGTASALTAAYWKGTATTGLGKIWAASDGSSDGNWASTAGGAAQALVPGSVADVIISATTPTVAPTGTTLGDNMSIKSLMIRDTVNGLGLNGDGSTLTLVGANGITMSNGVPDSLIGANVAMGVSQTWSNNSTVGTLSVTGVVSGAFGLTKSGVGTLALSGANTYSGITSNNAGTIVCGNAAALGTGTITFSGGTLKYGAGISADLSAQIKNSKLGAIIIDDNGQTVTYASAIDNTNTNGLRKLGSGTLILNGANKYTGGTTVSNGALMVNGSVTGLVTVAAGGTLGGVGVVSGVVTNYGAMMAGVATNAIGTLTVSNNLVMKENSSLVWKYTTGSDDQINVTGSLILPNLATANVVRVSGAITYPAVLISGFTSCPNSNLSGWIVQGDIMPSRVVVVGNQVLLLKRTGMILTIM